MIILYTNLIIDLFKTAYYIASAASTLIKMNFIIKIYSLSLYNSMTVIQGKFYAHSMNFNL